MCCGLLLPASMPVPTASAASAPPSAKNCTLQQYASLYVDYSRGGGPLIPVVIGDQPVRMWLNTGSALSGLEQSAAERLGLKARPLLPGTPPIQVGNRRINAYVTVPVMSLGNARFKNPEIVILPTPINQQPIADAPVGFLGMDMLGNLDVEFDFGHDKINLFSSEHCPDSAVYWAERYDVVPMRRGALGDLYFVMELDGKKLQTKLATGSEGSTLERSAARKLYGWDENSPGVQVVADEHGGASRRYRVMSLTASGLTVLNAQIYLNTRETECTQKAQIVTDHDRAAGFEGCMGAYPLNLGRSVLNKLRLYLAAKEQKLYFTTADAHQEATAPGAQ